MKRMIGLVLVLVAFLCAWNCVAVAEIHTVDLKGGSSQSQCELIPTDYYGKYIRLKTISSLGGASKGEQWFKLVAPTDGTYVITYKSEHNSMGVMDTLLFGVYSNALGGWADPNGLKITDDVQTVTTKAKQGEEVILELFDSAMMERTVIITVCFDGYHIEKECNLTVKFADCVENGEIAKTQCVLCNSFLRTEMVPALGHEKDPEMKTIKDAQCTETGLEGHLCKRCGEIIDMQETKALGHVEGKQVVAKEATCLAEGTTEVRCDRCGVVLSSEKESKTDHVPGRFVPYKEATCTTEGTLAQYCEICGTLLDTSKVPALGHTPGKWEVVREATETTDGLTEQQCTVCGEVLQNQTIQATGK